jgi:hypothetical protein
MILDSGILLLIFDKEKFYEIENWSVLAVAKLIFLRQKICF